MKKDMVVNKTWVDFKTRDSSRNSDAEDNKSVNSPKNNGSDCT